MHFLLQLTCYSEMCIISLDSLSKSLSIFIFLEFYNQFMTPLYCNSEIIREKVRFFRDLVISSIM